MQKIRISKILADRGMCSRREADHYIEKGWVKVDGRVAKLGEKAYPEQRISLDKIAQEKQQERVTIILNKPVGYVSHQAEGQYKTAASLIQARNQFDKDKHSFSTQHLKGLAPAGRLDIDSQGLLVLTQDGTVARQLIAEDSEVEKEYIVRVSGNLQSNGLKMLRHGLSLDGAALKPAEVEWINEDQLRFILQEGKKRQIRRMCEIVGLKVTGLKRVRMGNVLLADLPQGMWRYLKPHERFL
ncbi:pseudouridine synthase [Brackiella oedipodis]|uniref:pseudouridine synthase n=1 Tax=Brackiella oedipodis TaxID=124225 RepID=UPI00049110B3|nr:pseudouridine synthase [Brackiella oedipodis]